MLEGDTPNRYATVLIYYIMYARVNRVKDNLEGNAFAVYSYDIIQEFLKLLRTVNV